MLKLIYTLLFLVCHILVFSQVYDADFDNNNDGFPAHTTSSPPASAPASTSGGISPNGWTMSYTSTPSTDGTNNNFEIDNNEIFIQDWGGEANWESESIDVSALSLVTISALGFTIGNDVQNAVAEYFEYYYILDGGAPVVTQINLSGDVAGTAVNYNIIDLDVSTASSLVIGFNFQVNDAGDGYRISSYSVSSTVLPIEINSFSLTENYEDISIKWHVNSEVNNDYFTIEHSQDGRNYIPVGKVNGSGTSSIVNEYSFVHRNPVQGLNYYRLKQTDFNGDFEIFPAKSIVFKREIDRTSIYPTKFYDFINISNGRAGSTYSVLNIAGQQVTSGVINSEIEQVNLSFLQNGIYILQIKDGDNVKANKIVKQ